MRHLMTTPCSIRRAEAATDAYGDVVPGTARNIATVCMLSIGASTEAGVDPGDADATIYMPAETDLRSSDQLVVAGVAWDVIDVPVRHSRVIKGAHHVEARLRRRV
jgi:hypothetical protein